MDQRDHSRIRQDAVAGLDVLVVPVEGQAFHGRVIDMSATGVSVGIAQNEASSLEEGARTVLVLGAHQLDPPVTAAAVLLHQRIEAGELHLGLRFVDPEALMETLSSQFRHLFNARRAPRVRVEPHEPIRVAVSLPSEAEGAGEADAEEVDAALEDISATGLSLELPVELGAGLVEGTRLRLIIELPEAEAALPLTGTVRDCIPLGDRWRLGLEFDAEATPDFEVQQAPILAYVKRRRAEKAT